jgi:hypothetical protein
LRVLHDTSSCLVDVATSWLHALAGKSDGIAANEGTADAMQVMNALQLCVFVLSEHLEDALMADVSWVAAPVFALIVRQAPISCHNRRVAVLQYLESRQVVGSAALTFGDLEVLCVYTAPHHNLVAVLGDGTSAVYPVEDELVGCGSIAEFYSGVFAALVWLFSCTNPGVSERTRMLDALVGRGGLVLELLPLSTLKHAINSPSMPTPLLIEALLRQNALLVAQAQAAGVTAARYEAALLQAHTCKDHHVAIGTKLAIKRSTGAFASGTVTAYSPDTKLHKIEYSSQDKRWYNLSRTVYEVISVDDDSEEDDSEDNSEELEGE